MSAPSLRAFKDDRPVGSLLDFKVDDDHVLIGDFCNAHEGGLELRAGKLPLCWSDAPKWEGKGTVFANEIKCALPAKRGDWKAARLFTRDGSELDHICGAVFWHAGAVGQRSEDAAAKVQALVAAGGEFGENLENEAVLAAGWRFIGRYSWQYYCASQHVENLRLQDDDTTKMDMDGVYNHISGGPVCTFIDTNAYWDGLWPVLKAGVAAGKSKAAAGEEEDEAPMGLFAVPGGGGVAACFGSQEYCFARICFEKGGEAGRTEAVMLVCYTYNCPSSLLAVQVEAAPVQRVRPPEGARDEQLLEWVRGLTDDDGAAFVASFPASHAEELVKALLRCGAADDVRRAARLGLIAPAAAQPFFCAAVAQALAAGQMEVQALSAVLEEVGAMPAQEALIGPLLPATTSLAAFHLKQHAGESEGLGHARVRSAVMFLLERGLDPTVRIEENGLGFGRTVRRVPLLYRAVEAQDEELVRELLRRSADPTAKVTEEEDEQEGGSRIRMLGRSKAIPVDHVPLSPLRAAMAALNVNVARMLLEAAGGAAVKEEAEGMADVAVSSFVEEYEHRVRRSLDRREAEEGGLVAAEAVVAAELRRVEAVRTEALRQHQQLLACVRLVCADLPAYGEELKRRVGASKERAEEEAKASGMRVISSHDSERDGALTLAFALLATG